MNEPYLIGIDLGTTNSSIAYIHQKARGKGKTTVQIFDIPQLVKANVIEAKSSLPSFLYIAGEFDIAKSDTKLPWKDDSHYIVGQFARVQGQKVPGRLVHSAKSWLCHSGIDRYSQILPWGGKEELKKVSPVEATTQYLNFIKESWNHYKAKKPEEYLQKQHIVLTVPASFDEVARELTVEAAKNAGLTNVTLLEEPIAAFYYWIYRYHLKWPKEVMGNMLALICDVGGGTTDFSIVEIIPEENNFRFERIAVGDHLLLGGDNMDLALALYLEQTQAKKKLDTQQFAQLVGYCSKAKENLFNDEKLEQYEFSIVGTGSSVIGKSFKFSVTRDIIEKIIIEGFFPLVDWKKKQTRFQKAGFKEWGLPYESNPLITEHLSRFLKNHLPEGKKIDLVLFNGGALTPKSIQNKLQNQIGKWFAPNGDWKPDILTNNRLDLAVAYGSAYYNLVRKGKGIFIEGGTPRSYFLGFKTEKGKKAKGICILPFGSRQGESFDITEHKLEVLAAQPVSFPIYSSSTRKNDLLGDVVEIDKEQFHIIEPLHTMLKIGKKAKIRQIPVYLQIHYSEIGTLDLWLIALDSDRRWRLQFQVKAVKETKEEENESKEETPQIEIPKEEIRKIIQESFSKEGSLPPNKVVKNIESLLKEKKNSWNLAINRAIFDILIEFASSRKLSTSHEEKWLNLAGFTLRPGTGFTGDNWRIGKLWNALLSKIYFEKNIQSWMQWWVLWRRIAAGLDENKQKEIFRLMAHTLLSENSKWYNRKTLRKYVKSSEYADIIRAASSFEQLPIKLRCEIGNEILKQKKLEDAHYWALGRLGSRTPFYGNTVIPSEKINPWIDTLLKQESKSKQCLYTIAQLSRKTGDRATDIHDEMRFRVLKALDTYSDDPHIKQLYLMVKEVTALNNELKKHYMGDSLPTGLILKENKKIKRE